jgi:phenylpropionate dioxygenase-like ring-hydroxylating dioxygenase large terminal subunit
MTEHLFLDNDERLLRRAWHPVMRGTDLPARGGDVLLLGQEWSISRHDGALIARDRHGECAWSVRERYGLIWLAPETPVIGLPELTEYDDPSFGYEVLCRRTTASAGVLMDNFLDVTHFSYLHQRTFGLVRPVTVEHYELALDTWSVRLTHQTVLHESDDPVAGGAADLAGEVRVATYIYHPPYVTHLRMRFPGEGGNSASTLVCQPESATSTVAYVIVGWPAEDVPGLRAQLELSTAVLKEDLSMLELLEDARLPLSLKAELHTRADRAGVEMRRMLAAYLKACA